MIHELQAVETELGLPQTPLEVAMDDWALATVADLEDRTRIRAGVPTGGVAQRRRRRRRAAVQERYSGVGTLLRDSNAVRAADGDHARRAAGLPGARLGAGRRRRRGDRARRDGDAGAHPVGDRRPPGGHRHRRAGQRRHASPSRGRIPA